MSRSPEFGAKNEQLAKAFSSALARASLAIPLATGEVVLDAAINTPPAIAQEVTQVINCVVITPESRPASTNTTPGKILMECEPTNTKQEGKIIEGVSRLTIGFFRGVGIGTVAGTVSIGAFLLARRLFRRRDSR